MLTADIQKDVRECKIRAYNCKKCGHRQVDIQVFCSKCSGGDLEIVDVGGEGKIIAYTIQQVAPEQFMNDVPYAWLVVELDEGVRVTGWMPFIASSNDLKIGQRVRLVKSYRQGRVFEKV
jgi:uncharacterized OB-fold protein